MSVPECAEVFNSPYSTAIALPPQCRRDRPPLIRQPAVRRPPGGPVRELTLALVFLAGAVITVQAAINARLGQTLGNGMQAVLVSFAIGTVGALVYCLVEGAPLATADALRSGP